MRKILNEYGKLIISIIVLFAVMTAVIGGVWLNMVGQSLDMHLKEPTNMSLKSSDEVSCAVLKPYIEVESVSLRTGESVKLKSLIKAYVNADTNNNSNKISDDCISVVCSYSSYNKKTDVFTAETTGVFSVDYKVKTTRTINNKMQNIVGEASTTIFVDNNIIQSDTKHNLTILADSDYDEECTVKYKVKDSTLKNSSEIQSGMKVNIKYTENDDLKYTKTTLEYKSIEQINKKVDFDNTVTVFTIPSDIDIGADVVFRYQYETVPVISPALNSNLERCGISRNDVNNIIFSNEKIEMFNDYVTAEGNFQSFNFSFNNAYPIYARFDKNNGNLSFHSKIGKFNFNSGCSGMFVNFSNLKSITCSDDSTANFNKITSANSMFARCYKLENVDFGYNYTYSKNIPFQNVAHINFPNVETTVDMFSKCYNLQVFDMTGCKKMTTLPGIHDCVKAKRLIIEYDAAINIEGDKAKCLDYTSIEKFGMAVCPNKDDAGYYNEKIKENYNINSLDLTTGDTNLDRFQIVFVGCKGINYDSSAPKKIYIQTNKVNGAIEAAVFLGTPDDEFEKKVNETIKNWFKKNNNFSSISIYTNYSKCSSCGYIPIVDYYETYLPSSENISLLQNMEKDGYKCPKCGGNIGNKKSLTYIKLYKGIKYGSCVTFSYFK